MHRVAVMACAMVAGLALGACESGAYYDDRYGSGYYGNCDRAASCEACTPIVGCGWCSHGDGRGICLSEPNACRVEQFSWTWEPKGCGDGGVATDGGATDVSAGDVAESSAEDDSASEAASDADSATVDGSDDDGSGDP